MADNAPVADDSNFVGSVSDVDNRQFDDKGRLEGGSVQITEPKVEAIDTAENRLIPDRPYNPNVEVREVDDRTFNDQGQLTGGGVRQVMYVDGKEYKPPTQEEIAAEVDKVDAKSKPVTTGNLVGAGSDTPIGDSVPSDAK